MIDKILHRNKGIKRADGTVESQVRTPAFSSREFAWETRDRGAIVATSAVAGFSEALLSAIQQASAKLEAIESPSAIAMLPLENVCNPRMACLAAIRYPYHQRYANWDLDLAMRTVVVFPAYRSDFGGHESREIYDELVHTRTRILHWDRPERPQIWLRARHALAPLKGWDTSNSCWPIYRTSMNTWPHLAPLRIF